MIIKDDQTWKSLAFCVLSFWLVLCATDLLGEPTWKKCVHYMKDALQLDEHNNTESNTSDIEHDSNMLSNQSQLLTVLSHIWKCTSFLCSASYFIVIRVLPWLFWKLFALGSRVSTGLSKDGAVSKHVKPNTDANTVDRNETEKDARNDEDCKVLFKNHTFVNEIHSKPQLKVLQKALQEFRQQNIQLTLQLTLSEKEKMEALHQIEVLKASGDTLEKTSAMLRATTENCQQLAKDKEKLENDLYAAKKEREELLHQVEQLKMESDKLKTSLECVVERDDDEPTCESSVNLTNSFHRPDLYGCRSKCASLNMEENELCITDKENLSDSQLLDKFRNKLMIDSNWNAMFDSTDGEPCRIISRTTAFRDFMKKIGSGYTHFF